MMKWSSALTGNASTSFPPSERQEKNKSLSTQVQPSVHPLRGYLYIAAAGACWALAASLGKLAFTGRLIDDGSALTQIDPIILSQTRTTTSFLVVVAVLLIRQGRAGLAMPRQEI